MVIGYARVSTKDQELELQIDDLREYGCEKIFSEKISGSTKNRPELESLLSILRPKDKVVVWKLDRLGRSLKDLVNLLNDFQEKDVDLVSLNDNIDTSTSTGKLIFHLFAALSEFEKDIISERTRAGLKAARARGRKGGRPKGLSKEAKIKAQAAETLYKENILSTTEICKELGISRRTLYNYLRYRNVAIGS